MLQCYLTTKIKSGVMVVSNLGVFGGGHSITDVIEWPYQELSLKVQAKTLVAKLFC